MRAIMCDCGEIVPCASERPYALTLEDDEPEIVCEKCLREYSENDQLGRVFYIPEAGGANDHRRTQNSTLSGLRQRQLQLTDQ